MSTIPEVWKLWSDGTHSPFFNMAADELLLAQAAEWTTPLVRLYGWDRPAVSFGSSQKFPAELRDRYALVRRPTGGGVVYHDIDLTYTVVVPPGHAIMRLDRLASYEIFHAALLPELAKMGITACLKPDEAPKTDRATMRCFVSPSRFDVVSADGKYAGAAQRRTRNGILHQGSILLSAAHGDREQLKQGLLRALEQQFSITWEAWQPAPGLRREAEKLAAEKYETADWNERHGSTEG